MSADDLAAELLTAVLEADPLSGSLYGFAGYDSLLPDLGAAAELEQAGKLAAVAERSESLPESGLDEGEHQTLDFVRFMSRNMAGAARVPLIEFTICDTFVDPVASVLTMLPKLALDTEERRQGYLARLTGLPQLLQTASARHREGTAAGRTDVARLVESAVAQLDHLMADPALGAVTRSENDDPGFVAAARTAVDDLVRPALRSYQEALRSEILPQARDDAHPGICFLPDGEAMYAALARLHASTDHAPDVLHAIGREIVEEVGQELVETGSRIWGSTEPAEIFDRLTNDPALRFGNRDEMLEHARRVVTAGREVDEAVVLAQKIAENDCFVDLA